MGCDGQLTEIKQDDL